MISNSPRVLLVEDNPADVDLVREALASGELRPEVEVATDGVQAMERLRPSSRRMKPPLPDVILLDLNVPQISGREVLARVRKNHRTMHIPVIVLTSSTLEADVRASYDLGANCFLTKPLGFSAFRNLIRQTESFWFRLASLPVLRGNRGGSRQRKQRKQSDPIGDGTP